MSWAMLDKLMAKLKDSHIPVCLFMFIAGIPLQWFHHLDAAFVAYTGTILGAITGHAFFNKDKDGDGKPDE